MARGVDTGSHPNRQVHADRFRRPMKRTIVNQSSDDVPTIIGDVLPGRGVTTHDYGYPRLSGRAGDVQGRRPYVEPYNWESRAQS